MSTIKPPAPDDSLPPLTFRPTEAEVFLYCAALGTAHRIHYDRDYARDVEGLRDIVTPGPLQMAYLTELTGQWASGYAGRVTRLWCRHLVPAYVGEELECGGRVTSVDPATGTAELALWVQKADSGDRTTEATASVSLPAITEASSRSV